jgi:hypothetical protein
MISTGFDYLMDDQWNMWVKTGVQKLVSLDDVTEQAGNRVGQTTTLLLQFCRMAHGIHPFQWGE